MKRVVVFGFLVVLLVMSLCTVAWAKNPSDTNETIASISNEYEQLFQNWYPETWDSDSSYVSTMEIDGIECIYINNQLENDTRACQLIEVLPNTCYQIECDVYVQGITGDGGANVTVIDSSVSSEHVFQTEQWKHITLTGVTGENQTTLTLALRLGHHGMLACGEAWFTNMKMSQLDYLPSDAVSFAAMQEIQQHSLKSFYLFIGLVVILALILFAFSYRYFEKNMNQPNIKNELSYLPLFLLSIAFLVRIVISFIFPGHPTDIVCFQGWAITLADNGLNTFYTSGMFADYPPGYMYILWFIGEIAKLFRIPAQTPLYILLIKLPAILADLISAYFIYRFAQKKQFANHISLILMGIFAFNPLFIFLSGGWGQIDSLLTLFLLIFLYFYMRDAIIPAGIVFGISILMKPQALIFAPLFLSAYIVRMVRLGIKKQLVPTLVSVLSAFVIIFLLSLPFQGTQEPDWLLGKYFLTATSYPYASVEAFNLPALLGGNWVNASNTAIFFSYQTWGYIFLVLILIVSVIAYVKFSKKDKSALLLISAFYMSAIFTLVHYMHERYLFPALPMLLLSFIFIKDRRLLISYCWFSISMLLNVLAAYFVAVYPELRNNSYHILTIIGSFIEVSAFIYLVKIIIDLVLLNKLNCICTEKDRPVKKSEKKRNISQSNLYEKKYVFSKKDRWLCFALTVVYSIYALVNLGSLSAPETTWKDTSAAGESVVAFDAPTFISKVRINGNIGQGTIVFQTESNPAFVIEQTYDDMFRWVDIPWQCMTDRIAIEAADGVCLNEVAFFDEFNQQLHIPAISESAKPLFDEQNTVPNRISYLNGMYFDELYHARTAYEHLHGMDPYENSHPPLGKIFIMLGIGVFGMNPFGWRIVGVLFGIAMLPLLYCFAKRLTRNSYYALLAAGLFAFDFMHFTQTRIATIDVFAVFFIILMYYYIYQYITLDLFVDGWKKSIAPLCKSGIAFAFGAATKWTCIFAGIGLAVLVFASFFRNYRIYKTKITAESNKSEGEVLYYPAVLWKTILLCIAFFIIIPIAVYILSYLPYFLCEKKYQFADIIDIQKFMLHYHSTLEASHPYQSSFWQWPFTLRPIWYFFGSYKNNMLQSSIAASGNPAVWWLCTIGTILFIVIRLFKKKITFDQGEYVPLVGICACYFPWFTISRCTFIYHFFPVVPFIILFSVCGLQKLETYNTNTKWIKWGWIVAAIILFILLYPGISGLPISAHWARFLKYLPGGNLFYGA